MSRRGFVGTWEHPPCPEIICDVEHVELEGFKVTAVFRCRRCGEVDEVPLGEPSQRQELIDRALQKMMDQGILDRLEDM